MSANPIGLVLLGQYRVDAFIGAGGMSTVYKAWDQKRSVYLAMKVLHADLADDPSVFKLFQREARALGKLAHPNIVPFYGLLDDRGIFFLLEHYVDGPSLKEILRERRGQPLAIPEALSYLKAICAALGYAHVHMVVHCDVKPGNVMVDRGGTVYLTDFGVARHAESTTTTLASAGTPAYMAPEQIRGDSVSPETDIYALGVVLYEMLTGRRPFQGGAKESQKVGPTAAERVRFEHLNLHPLNPRNLNPEIPEALAQVVLKALAKNPAARYHNTQTLYDQVCLASNIIDGQVIDRIAMPVVAAPGIDTAATPPEPEQPRTDQDDGKPKIPKWAAFIAGFGVLAALACISVVLLLRFPSNGGTIAPEIIKTESRGGATIIVVTATEETTRLEDKVEVLHTEIPTPTSPPAITVTPSPTNTSSPTSTPVQTLLNPKDNAALVLIPAGQFLMGSDPENDPDWWGAEGPMHRVALDDFWVYQTEVTNAMYQLCAEEKACPKPEYSHSATRDEYYGSSTYDQYPVIQVSWVHATSYCRWAGGRLPTEAEWEKSARGTDSRLFPWGNLSPSGEYLNFCDSNCTASHKDNSYDDGYRDTAPVGSYPHGVSPYGVLDVAGNVWEWTRDWFDETYYQISPQENPLGPASGTTRVVRGGSWFNPDSGVRTVARASYEPDLYFESVGFRCVVEANSSLIEDLTQGTNESPPSTLAPTVTSTLSQAPTVQNESIDPQGKIVFTCQIFKEDHTDQICLMNADGSGYWRLTTNDNKEHFYASLSPNGLTIVFSSNLSGNFEIYEMDLTGKMTRITQELGDLYAPEISPDGQSIVFTNENDGHQAIWVMNRNGTNPHEVFGSSQQDGWDPVWSPDGNQILFASGPRDDIQLFIMNKDGTNLRQVTHIEGLRGRSDWSPDGNMLSSYVGTSWNRELILLDLEGTIIDYLTDGGNNLAPGFSPGGEWITFTSYMDRYNDPHGCEIYIMRQDGSDLQRLTNNDYCDWQPRWGP